MPVEIEQLQRRQSVRTDFDADSDKARALAFLAADNTMGYRPSEIAARTEITEESAARTMQRLREVGYVTSIDGYYFISRANLPEIRRMLTDGHTMKHLRRHVEGDIEWGEVDDVAGEAAALVDDVSDRMTE